MSFWKTIKEMLFGAPLGEQLKDVIEQEAAKVSDQITDAVTQAKAKRKRASTAGTAPKKRVSKKNK